MATQPYIARKFVAVTIDSFIIFFLAFILIFLLGEPVNDGDGTYRLNGFPALLPILGWAVLTIGFEQLFGSTVGNGVVGLKPIPEDGTNAKISFLQSLKRHLLDPIDLFFFGLVAYLVIKSNPKNQRLGDIWAKTIVVKAEDN